MRPFFQMGIMTLDMHVVHASDCCVCLCVYMCVQTSASPVCESIMTVTDFTIKLPLLSAKRPVPSLGLKQSYLSSHIQIDTFVKCGIICVLKQSEVFILK